jgi:NitT/TauT family transport system ATP-binding protein
MSVPALAVAAATTPLLSVTQVSKIYGDGDHRFVAVQGVNLSLQEDEFVCLLGPSGCGKSTLLRIITGLNTATSGTVHYRGQVVPGVNPHATIVFQTFALYPWLTVLQNVEIALKARGVALPERRQRAGQLLETVGLAGFEAAYPRELSGGMRQKVGFARAMAVEPELLCLDEPFSALDVLSAEALRGELLELWLHKTIPTRAILMVTHNIEEAVLLADRIVIMGKDPGHIVSELNVTLHHPRRRKDTAVQALVDQVFAIVTGHTAPPVDAPGQPRHRLPHARLNALAGLVEKLANEGGSANLYRISGELMLHLDELLPLVEAGKRLEFLTVQAGDVRLTPLGQTYADASILARKELLAARILRLPAPRWIYEILQQDDNQRVDRHYFLDKLSADFGDQAEEQLEIIINWGRYAELFAYDSGSNELYLES